MAISHYYVDPAGGSNGNSGTIGSPWQTVQYALDHITRNSTSGDQINIKSNQAVGTTSTAADTLSAALSLATYGTPTATAPLILRGYSSTLMDGGKGLLSGGGAVAIINSTALGVVFRDLRATNCGANAIITLSGTFAACINVEADNSTGGGIVMSGVSLAENCNVHNVSGNYGIYAGNALGNNVWPDGRNPTNAVYIGGQVGAFNLVRTGGATKGIVGDNGSVIRKNSVYGSASTGPGITDAGNRTGLTVEDNYVEGHSGTGGTGYLVGTSSTWRRFQGNRGYNNATLTNVTTSNCLFVDDAGVTDASSQFADAAGGNFAPKAGSTLVGSASTGGAFNGLATTVCYPDTGAVQHQDAGAGGGTYTDPGVANVKTGTAYTYNSVSQTGTYDGSDRWTDPGVTHVQAGTAYKANSTTNNRTGTYDPVTGQYTDPGVGNVANGTTYLFAGATQTGTYSPTSGATLSQITTLLASCGLSPALSNSGTGVTVGGHASGKDPAALVLNAVAASYNAANSIGAKINAGGTGGSVTVASGGITAASFDTGALTAAAFGTGLRFPASLAAADVTGYLPANVLQVAGGTASVLTAPPTAAQIATAVWTDTAGGDFSALGSPGYVLNQNLDAKVSTRSTYAGGAVSSVTAPVSLGSVAPSWYTAPSTTVTAYAVGLSPAEQLAASGYSPSRAAALDNLANLDAAVSTRLAASAYTVPPGVASIATAVLTTTTAGDFAVANSPGSWLAGWRSIETVLSVVAATSALSFRLDSSASADDNAYAGQEFAFRTGALRGQRRLVASYVGLTRALTVSAPFTAAPSVGDVGEVI